MISRCYWRKYLSQCNQNMSCSLWTHPLYHMILPSLCNIIKTNGNDDLHPPCIIYRTIVWYCQSLDNDLGIIIRIVAMQPKICRYGNDSFINSCIAQNLFWGKPWQTHFYDIEVKHLWICLYLSKCFFVHCSKSYLYKIMEITCKKISSLGYAVQWNLSSD